MRPLHGTLAVSTVIGLIFLGPSELRGEHPNHDQGFNARNAFSFGETESVNLFNGNLNLTIPIGPAYPVGPDLSYRLMLTYTGNIWEWELEGTEGCTFGPDCYLQALPRFRSNAGLGWEVTLGRFQRAADPLNTSDNPTYESPDQGLHELYPGSLHSGGESFSGVHFSRDSTYLRYTQSADRLELPDGTIQTFGTYGVERIEDRFANWVEVSYTNIDPDADEPLTWTIADIHGREHTVTLEKRAVTGGDPSQDDPSSRGYRVVATTVKLDAFGGQTAQYDLSYVSQFIPRACNVPTGAGDTSNVKVPFLTGISLPEGLSYTIGAGGYHIDTISCSEDSGKRLLNGHLTDLGLPTGGKLEWAWQPYAFPLESSNGDPLADGPSPLGGPPFQRAAGIATRTHRKRDGTELGTWSYTQELVQDPATNVLVESKTTVIDPIGHEQVNYFNVYVEDDDPDNDPTGYVDDEYGLPFTRQQDDGTTPKRFLSREVSDKNGTLLRSDYVRYEHSNRPFNPRLVSRRTVYNDDSGKLADLDLSDFDGLGHYRQATASGTGFPGTSSRTTLTNWNPGHSISDIPDPGEPWILDTYDLTQVSEGGQTATREFWFRGDGFLRRTRTRKGASCGAEDVIVERIVSQENPGFVGRVDHLGGDGASLPCGNLSGLDLSTEGVEYRRKHTYSCGSPESTQWFNPGSGALSFLSLDQTIDCPTGLVASSRDTTGLQTTFAHDLLGRLTKEDIQTGQGADTHYTYFPEGSLPARVTIQRKDGTTVLTNQEIRLDGFGRINEERRTQPDESLAIRKTRWNALGLKEQQSEWEASGDSDPSWTIFGDHDPFGRPGTVTLPDGQQITVDYLGVRRRTTRVPIATSLDSTGNPVTSQERTTEFYDRFGRLHQLWEPDLDDGTRTRTRYTYDALSNLTKVEMNFNRTPNQVRTFDYDHRGFLTFEVHPELGSTVTYSDYDPFGNPGRIQRGDWDLEYTYDPASRLTQIRAKEIADDTWRTWKTWEYATGNFQAGQWSNGKLAESVRHNYVIRPGTTTEIDADVTESYMYDGVGGRISHVNTVVGVGDPSENTQPTYDYTLAYTQLGNVASRTYPECSHRYCVDVNEVRTVTNAYSRGWLTGIPGYASAITYHPNGLYDQVSHTNGVLDLQENDPEDMARTRRLQTSGASEEFDTGLYDFDGASNVTKMGTDRFIYDSLSRIEEAQVEIPGRPCGEELILQNDTEDSTVNYENCGTIQAGPSYTVSSTGDVTLTAGHLVEFTDGFSVASDGRVVAGTDPTLDPEDQPHDSTQSYSYDRFGNLESITTDEEGKSSVTRTPTADPTTNRLTGAGYDLSGNVTSWGGWEYRRDPFGMMNQARPTGANGYTFVYAPGDERIWAVDWTRGTDFSNWLETWTLRDNDGTPLRQYQSDGGNQSDNWSLHRDYIWRGSALLAARSPEIAHDFHLDHLRSPRIITDANGQTLSEHFYYPFGEEASDPTIDAEVLKYTGHQRDDLDGGGTTADLDYMHARFHSPHQGRFFSVDPVGGNAYNPQSWNRYSYVLANPLKYVDPRGLFPCPEMEDVECQDEITVYGSPHGADSLFFGGLLFRNLSSFTTGFGFLDVGHARAFYERRSEAAAGEGNVLATTAYDSLLDVLPASQGALGLELAFAAIPGPFDNVAGRTLKGTKLFDDTLRFIDDFLGAEQRAFKNEAGDLILESADGLRQIRFDINNVAPHDAAHVHLIKWRNVKNRKVELLNKRIFPGGGGG